MFIKNLDGNQHSLLLSLAHLVIKADERLAPEEDALLEALQGDSKTRVVWGEEVSMSQVVAAFKTKKAKVSLLLELLGVAHVDAEYHVAEKSVISNVAEALGIAKPELENMESWAVRQLALVRQAQEFMQE